MSTPTLTPAETAARTGLSIDTLRYYEREGLVGPVGRASSGHRTYSDDDLFWIGLVTCLRDAGLGIAELREFTTLLRGEADAGDRVAFLRAHRAELEGRVATIQKAIGVLTDKIAYYSEGAGPQG